MRVARARNTEDKQERRGEILAAGLALFEEMNFADIRMVDVAERAGVAKGTVYLYFATKEELFLSLLEDEVSAWFDHVDQSLSSRRDWNGEKLAKMFADSLDGREALVRILATLGTILEHNVTVDRARQFKQLMLQRVVRTGELLREKVTFLRGGAGARLILHIHALVVGLGQMAFPATVTCQLLDECELALFRIDLRKEFHFILKTLFRGME